MNTPRSFTITQLRLDDDGVWRARITGPDGNTYDVDRQYGSWQATVRAAPRSRTMVRRDVVKDAAAALQARVRPMERKANRGAALTHAQTSTRVCASTNGTTNNNPKETTMSDTTTTTPTDPATTTAAAQKAMRTSPAAPAKRKPAAKRASKPAASKPAKPAKPAKATPAKPAASRARKPGSPLDNAPLVKAIESTIASGGAMAVRDVLAKPGVAKHVDTTSTMTPYKQVYRILYRLQVDGVHVFAKTSKARFNFTDHGRRYTRPAK